MKNISKVLGLVIALILAAGQFCMAAETPAAPAKPSTEVKAVESLQKLYEEGNFTKMIEDSSAALKKNPNDYDLLCMLGIGYGANGEMAKAEETFNTAIKLQPNEWRAYTFMADTKRAQKNYKDAIAYYNKALVSPTLSKEGGDYYKGLIKETIKEQQAANADTTDLSAIKNSINLNLGTTWERISQEGDGYEWIALYRPKGKTAEEMSDFVTVQFLQKDFYPSSVKDRYDSHITALKDIVKTLPDAKLDTKIISEKPTEIIYEWTLAPGMDTEIVRAVKTNKGLYQVYYTHPGKISDEEKAQWLNTLKSAEIKE